MEVKQVKVTDITPYEKNAKIHPDHQIEQIAQSLNMFGWQQPMVISKDGIIVIGHGRFEAAKLLGMDEVPCVIAEDLTDDEIRELRLADNKLNESPWDMNVLKEELQDLDFGELNLDWGEAGTMLDESLIEQYFNSTDRNAEIAKKKEITCPYCGETFEV